MCLVIPYTLLQGYNTGYPYKGMHLLEPGLDPAEKAKLDLRREARRRKREQQQKQVQHEQQQSNPWQFLDHRMGTSESSAPSSTLKQVSSSNIVCMHFDNNSDILGYR